MSFLESPEGGTPQPPGRSPCTRAQGVVLRYMIFARKIIYF